MMMTNEESEDLEYLLPEYVEVRKEPRNEKEVITEILAYHDLMGFTAGYFPDDEYDIEARWIMSLQRKASDLRELRWMIYDVFVFCFSETSVPVNSDRRYRYIAEEIWDLWQEEIENSENHYVVENKLKGKKSA